MKDEMPASDVETDPRLHDAWLTHFSTEEQDALRMRWNRQAEEEARQSHRERRRAVADHLTIIAVFAAGDLLHGWGGGLSFFTALCLGAFLGGLILLLEAPRAFAAVMGGAALFLHQWLVRGGLSIAEAAMLLPLLAILWLVGRRRELLH
jgi:hypothetical protein